MSTDQKHTPEPWHIARNEISETIFYCRGLHSETATTYGDKDGANARRIVACVNACAGISTETLEAAPPWKVYAADKAPAAQRDELVAALRALMAGVTAYNLSSMRTVDIAGQAEARAILAKVLA